MTTKPDTLIIRIADQDGSKTFVNLPLDEQGFIMGADAHEFQVVDGDTYNLLDFNQLVFAISSDGGQSSIELARVTAEPVDPSAPAVVAYENPYQVALMAKDIFDNWDTAMASAVVE